MSYPESKTRRGRVQDGGKTCPTHTCNSEIGVVCVDDTQGFDGVRYYKDEALTLRSQRSGLKVTNGFRIRKLTPKECFRLQGFPDEYFERAASVNSNSQLYKQAGNSVTVNVIYEIAKRLGGIQ